ncbi:MAG: hypothetical protein R3349_07535, partial [Geminicoccaceae bacterium]|nr:hypothetical protein [Geminicoccaceae bacterium]
MSSPPKLAFWRLLVLGLVALMVVIRPSPAAAGCTEGACFGVSGAIVTVDSTRGALLNAVLSTLLGSSINISVGTWTGIADGSVDLAGLIDALQVDLDLAGPDQVLAADVSVLQLLDATADALEAD